MNILPEFLLHFADKIEAKWLMFNDLKNYKSAIHQKVQMDAIRKILKSEFFDAHYYRGTYQLKHLSDTGLAAYYLYIGFRQDHNPSAAFSGKGYYWLRPDVRKQDLNPLMHFIDYGCREGMKPYSVSELEALRINDDAIAEVEEMKKHGKVVLLLSHEMSLTGAPRALLNLAIILKKLGVESVFATLTPGDLEGEVERAGLKSRILMMSGMDKDSDFAEEIKRYISSFDMILFNTIVALPYVEYIKDLEITKACWIHDGSYGFSCSPYISQFANLFPLFDTIFVVGDYAKTIALSFSNYDIEMDNLIYGIDDHQRDERQHEEHEGVVMVLAGTVEERKGQDILLESLRLLKHDLLQQLRIYIIGKTINTSIYSALKDDKSGCLNILGVIPHEDVIKQFLQMDILLCPSLDDPMPIVCTEAMMLSKPVIVSDHTGTASFIHDEQNGYVVKAGNPQSLAAAITKAIHAKNKLLQMGRRARRIFEENFTNEMFENNVRKKILPLLSTEKSI